MRACCPVPRGRRRDQLTGERQSSGQDVASGIAVCMIAVAARDAGEDRLAIVVRGVGAAADVALLRGETRVDEDHLDAGRLALVLDPPGENAPARGEDADELTGAEG